MNLRSSCGSQQTYYTSAGSSSYDGVIDEDEFLLINKLKWKWLNDYALPICMVIGMVVADIVKGTLLKK